MLALVLHVIWTKSLSLVAALRQESSHNRAIVAWRRICCAAT